MTESSQFAPKFDPKHYKKLKQYSEKKDLSEWNENIAIIAPNCPFLDGANLSKAFISGANLSGSRLRRADLSGSNIRESCLWQADLESVNLEGADLTDANLFEANLTSAHLRGAKLRRAYLRDASLSGANLREADLYGADLGNANLRNADLTGADIRYANLENAQLEEISKERVFNQTNPVVCVLQTMLRAIPRPYIPPDKTYKVSLWLKFDQPPYLEEAGELFIAISELSALVNLFYDLKFGQDIPLPDFPYEDLDWYNDKQDLEDRLICSILNPPLKLSPEDRLYFCKIGRGSVLAGVGKLFKPCYNAVFKIWSLLDRDIRDTLKDQLKEQVNELRLRNLELNVDVLTKFGKLMQSETYEQLKECRPREYRKLTERLFLATYVMLVTLIAQTGAASNKAVLLDEKELNELDLPEIDIEEILGDTSGTDDSKSSH